MDTLERTTHLNASTTPVEDIAKIAYQGQPEHMRMYRTGYEPYFNSLPVLVENESLIENMFITKEVMMRLSEKLQEDKWYLKNQPKEDEFDRTIIGMEKPTYLGTWLDDNHYQAGKELVIARWGNGKTSPVHGHAPGYMHEELLSGKLRVNLYQITDEENRVVRPLRTDIIEPGVFVQKYVNVPEDKVNKRNVLPHNFTSIGNSVSLHYLPEHTRDGRDNGYTVEEWTGTEAMTIDDVEHIDALKGLYLQKGDVALVRSTNVPEYGDHFIIITGHPVMKEHGFRPQEFSIMASANDTALLNQFPMKTGLTLLKLNKKVAEDFLAFHNITVENGEVILPE